MGVDDSQWVVVAAAARAAPAVDAFVLVCCSCTARGLAWVKTVGWGACVAAAVAAAAAGAGASNAAVA
jgi:hypothetical protein